MKPVWLDEQEYIRMQNLAKEALKQAKMPKIELLVEVQTAGQWLWERLLELGFDNDKAYSVTFAHGQACFPFRDLWTTAQAILKQVNDGNAPEGGRAYGDALLNGDVSGLPDGGMTIKVCHGES